MIDRSTDDDGEPARRNVDELFRLLANARRRQIVTVLEAHEEDRIRVETLRQRLCSRFETVDADEWKIQFRHVHRPKLQESGLVEYDWRERTIRYDDSDLVSSVLAALESEANG